MFISLCVSSLANSGIIPNYQNQTNQYIIIITVYRDRVEIFEIETHPSLKVKDDVSAWNGGVSCVSMCVC
jgi:hypothetical protein